MKYGIIGCCDVQDRGIVEGVAQTIELLVLSEGDGMFAALSSGEMISVAIGWRV